MEINLESAALHSIQSYSDTHVTINKKEYDQNLIVNHDHITPWSIHSEECITQQDLQPLLNLNPEVILLGHPFKTLRVNLETLSWLTQQRIGIECMSLGAACRTFNILLSEKRAVVLGIVFKIDVE